ncbi:putative nuclear pore protein [Diplodia seriata]|uniref:Putative nuclear pore protein n=1 Tax=Diplodia seriata TaxID=420778 RepID=A0A0G2EFJ9_9PEZI|nr:putative nuclear pore protein [Diplodia seriata]
MSSLFGSGFGQNNQANKPAGGGLFGGLGGGAPSSAAGQTGGGLFGGAPPATSTGPSLFGNLGAPKTTAPASGGLFGSTLGGAQNQQQQTTTGTTGGGLLGGLGGLGASTAQPQSGGGGFFGGLNANNQQPAQQQQQQQQQPNPLGQTQQQAGSLSQSQAATGQTAYFDHLLERSRKRAAQENGTSAFGDLPSLQLGLGDIARKVRNLGQGGPSAPLARDSKAHYLLAASGVNTSSALKDLNQFSVQAGVGAQTAIPSSVDVDIDAYISNLHSQSTLAMIAEGLEQSKKDFDNFLEDNIQMEWDAQRKRIYEHFGLGRQVEHLEASVSAIGAPVERGAFGRSKRKGRGFGASASVAGVSFGASAMHKSVIGAPSAIGGGRASGFADSNGPSSAAPVPESRFMRDKQEKYAAKVKELNVSRLEERPYPVLAEFAEIEKLAPTDNSNRLIESYNALVEIIGERMPDDSNMTPAPKERQFAQDYLDETPTSGRSIAMRKRILDGGRSFLEKKFLADIKEMNAKNPTESMVGGEPTQISQVRGFIRLLVARKELAADSIELQSIGEDFCWALIFYLLRAGLAREALDYVADNERAIRSLDRNFPSYLAAFVNSDDRRLPPELQTRINAEYQNRMRLAPENSLDPYRMACYKVVGRCELSRTTLEGISKGMEDWAWLQFSLAREVNRAEEAAGETFALDNIRSTIADITQRHFQGSDANAQYGVCFLLHMLSGMFEEGVNFLYQQSYTTAVHFAIGLSYYGLLRVADFFTAGTDIMSFSTRSKPQINFCRIIGHYTRDFRAARAEAAADYLVLLNLNADLDGQLGQSQAACCHEALRELVLETREFALLLGDIRSDGTRITGVIEFRLRLIGLSDQEEFLKNITLQAAAVADEAGRTTDAVLLYHLAEDYDSVIAIVNRALSDALAVDIGQKPHRLEPLKPRAAARRPEDESVSSLSLTAVDDPAQLAMNMNNLYSANALMYNKVSIAKSLVEQAHWAGALDAIHETTLLPTGKQSNMQEIRRHAQTFNGLPPVVARLIGHLLMWTIICCGRRREELRQASFEATAANKNVVEQLETTAKDMMVFAGLVRYKLPPRVFEALARAGQEIGA